MQYLKIAEIANKCEVKRQQINEYYRMIGANSQFTKDLDSVIYESIKYIQRELDILENKLKKLVL